MPNAALIALTSPLMVADSPETLQTPLEPALYETSSLAADHHNGGIIALSWSLAAQSTALPQESPDQPPGEPEDDEIPESENVIVVEGTYGPSESDPVEAINAETYRITQKLDEAFVEPLAYGYRDGLPGPLRDGLGNFVRNLGEPNNALNFLLQGKFGKAFETLGRFFINSTLGFGGLVDFAKKPGIGLTYRRNGFGNTLGFYGVGTGPYLYLPVTGATSARDVIGSGLDQLLLPVAVGEPFNRLEFSVPFYIVSNLDARLEVDAELKRIDQTIDPYAARRDSYLYRRAKEIAELKGEEPPEPPAIMEEVEGTGEFADPPQRKEGSSEEAALSADKRPLVVITRRKKGVD